MHNVLHTCSIQLVSELWWCLCILYCRFRLVQEQGLVGSLWTFLQFHWSHAFLCTLSVCSFTFCIMPAAILLHLWLFAFSISCYIDTIWIRSVQETGFGGCFFFLNSICFVCTSRNLFVTMVLIGWSMSAFVLLMSISISFGHNFPHKYCIRVLSHYHELLQSIML